MRFDMHNGTPPQRYLRIDRLTVYGNPFTIGKHGTREDVIRKHKEFLNKKIQEALSNGDYEFLSLYTDQRLVDGDVACWCAPNQLCHGDTLKEIAIWLRNQNYASLTNLE